jgi:hypothetical protein
VIKMGKVDRLDGSEELEALRSEHFKGKFSMNLDFGT